MTGHSTPTMRTATWQAAPFDLGRCIISKIKVKNDKFRGINIDDDDCLLMVNCFYYDKSPFFDFKLELANTIPELGVCRLFIVTNILI